MRLRLGKLAILLVALASLQAFATPIAGHPGWKLEKAEKAQDAEAETSETDQIEYADFFTLYPNDARPPITIDGDTANRILAGQITPEAVYLDRTGGSATAKTQNQDNGAVGWQVAESSYVPFDPENPSKNKKAASISLPATQGTSSTPGSASLPNSIGNNSPTVAATAAAYSTSSAKGNTTVNSPGSANSVVSAPSPSSSSPTPTSPTAADTSNLTYSQMIDAATQNAGQSLCAKMGSYAPAGQCK